MSFGEFKNQVGIQQKNVTLSNIIKLYEDIADANEYIQDFTFGDIFEIDLKETNYALAHLSIENANYTTHELTYSFSLYVMDLVSTDEGNENDVLSDTLQVIGLVMM